MYEKSRDLSYEDHRDIEFYKKISGLIGSFDNDETRLLSLEMIVRFGKTFLQMLARSCFRSFGNFW